MKFEIGKKYRMRDGRVAEFVRHINHDDLYQQAVWLLTTNGKDDMFRTNRDGHYRANADSAFDIISDVPIREKVEVTVPKAYAVVFGKNSPQFSSVLWGSEEEAIESGKNHGEHFVGIYPLDTTILVEPIN